MERITFEPIEGSYSYEEFSERVRINLRDQYCCVSWNCLQEELIYHNIPSCIHRIITPEFCPRDITLRIFFNLCGLNREMIENLKSKFSPQDSTINLCWDNYIDTPIKDIPLCNLG